MPEKIDKLFVLTKEEKKFIIYGLVTKEILIIVR